MALSTGLLVGVRPVRHNARMIAQVGARLAFVATGATPGGRTTGAYFGDTTGQRLVAPMPARWRDRSAPHCVVWCGRIESLPSSNTPYWGFLPNDIDNSPWSGLNVGTDSNGAVRFHNNHANAHADVQSVNGLVYSGQFCVLAVQRGRSGREIFLNGRLVYWDTTVITPVYASSAILHLGSYTITSDAVTMSTVAAYAWDRPLSAAEHAALTRDPLAPMRRASSVLTPVAHYSAATMNIRAHKFLPMLGSLNPRLPITR